MQIENTHYLLSISNQFSVNTSLYCIFNTIIKKIGAYVCV